MTVSGGASFLSKMFLGVAAKRRGLGAIVLLPLLGCGKSGGGSAGTASEASIDPAKLVDQTLLTSILGEYEPKDRAEGEWYKLTISADKIRCNHSNHKDEYTSHDYAVVYAQDGTVRLQATGGNLEIKYDEAGGKYTVDASGICSWGIENPYKQTKRLDGAPPILLDVDTDRDAVSGTVGEEVVLPRGTLLLSEVKTGSWDNDDGSTPVVELNVTVKAPDGKMVEPFLARDISEVATTDENVWSASCGDVSSRGTGNPSFKHHREPEFDSGVYTGWGGHRETLVKPGKSRKGLDYIADDQTAGG